MTLDGASLKISAKGQVTLNKKILAYLGIQPGDRIELTALPGRRLRLARVGQKRQMSDLIGLLAPHEGEALTDAQIQAGIAEGAVAAYRQGDEDDTASDRAA